MEEMIFNLAKGLLNLERLGLGPKDLALTITFKDQATKRHFEEILRRDAESSWPLHKMTESFPTDIFTVAGFMFRMEVRQCEP